MVEEAIREKDKPKAKRNEFKRIWNKSEEKRKKPEGRRSKP